MAAVEISMKTLFSLFINKILQTILYIETYCDSRRSLRKARNSVCIEYPIMVSILHITKVGTYAQD